MTFEDFCKKPVELQKKYIAYEDIRQTEEIELLTARLGVKNA